MCAKASASAGGHAKWNIMGLKAPMYVKASDSTASSKKTSGHFLRFGTWGCHMSFFCTMSETRVWPREMEVDGIWCHRLMPMELFE